MPEANRNTRPGKLAIRMNGNLTGYVSTIVAILVFVAVYAFSNGLNTRLRFALLVILSILSAPSILVILYYFHILPETECFYSFRALWGSEFAILFPAAAAGMISSFLPRVLIAFPLFALLLVGLGPYIKPLISPLDINQLQDRWKGDACLQSTSSTCGPASVASILKHFGIQLSERDIARDAHSYTGGTEAWYLARVVRKNGFGAKFVFRTQVDPNIPLPALAGVRIGGMGHFIAVLSRQDGKTTFVDPLSGEETMPTDDFLKRYRFTGFHMTVTKR